MKKFAVAGLVLLVAGLFSSVSGAASSPPILGEWCAGVGNHPMSARIITRFTEQGGKIVAQHVFGNRNTFANAMQPQSGMTSDTELHPVTVDGNDLSYKSGAGYDFTVTWVSSSTAKVTQKKGTYYDKYEVTCGPSN